MALNKPYQSLGSKLKYLREKSRESLAEVSGALEIDIDTLNEIEQGKSRPNEDTLLMLITHFSVNDEEATKLWELAGFESAKNMTGVMNEGDKPIVMVLPMDARIVYSDLVHVVVNNYGVVMNFMQGSGPGSQPLAISRIGMSIEHAQSVLKVLQETLDQHQKSGQPKLLTEDNKNS